MAGPHRPWRSTEYIFVAIVPHKTFHENIWELKFKAQNINRSQTIQKLHF